MNTKFTKGPWVKDKRGECLAGSEGIDVCVWGCGLSSSRKSEETVANSDLIAAAPDMYAMIEDLASELHQAIDECNDQRLSRVTSQTETPPDLWDMQSLHEAQLLLKKARGE